MTGFLPKYLALAVLVLLSGCGKQSENNETAVETAEKHRTSDPDAAGGNTCLLAYSDKYDQLLGEADVLDATGFSKNVMETEYNKVLKNPVYHSFEYKFKNKRVGMAFGLDMEIEQKDIVKVAFIKPMSMKQFRDSYRVVTDQEMQAAKQALADIADEKSTDPDAKAALQKAKEHNVSGESVKKVGGGMLDIIKEVSKANTDVADLGDAAVWNTATNDLYVLQNGVKFEVNASVDNDKEKNKAVAIAMAKIILNKCK